MQVSERTAAEIRALEELPDSEIDTSDIPERLDWTGAVRGRFGRDNRPRRFAERDRITPELRSAIRRLSAEGMDIYQVSSELGVTPGRVRAIKAHFPRTNERTANTTPKPKHVDLDDPILRRKWLRNLHAGARKSAKKKDFVFELESEAFLEKIYEEQEGRCAVSGIKFNLERFPDVLVKHPFAPSIDRKLSSGGYTKDNVRLVCVLANFAMNQWGEEPFITVARGVVERDKIATNELSEVCVDAKWAAELRERITTAEELLRLLPPGLQSWQRHHIAGLKAALKKGLKRSQAAGSKAGETRKRSSKMKPR